MKKLSSVVVWEQTLGVRGYQTLPEQSWIYPTWQVLKGEGEGEGGIWVVSRPNSLLLPFQTPPTQAILDPDYYADLTNVHGQPHQNFYIGQYGQGLVNFSVKYLVNLL